MKKHSTIGHEEPIEIRHFSSFEAMDEADREAYRALTPQERLDMMVQLISNVIGTRPASRLGRRYRVTSR